MSKMIKDAIAKMLSRLDYVNITYKCFWLKLFEINFSRSL